MLYFLFTPISFNTRSRVGSDQRRMSVLTRSAKFQFTLPCRERPSTSAASQNAA